jgi:hypothetical protein
MGKDAENGYRSIADLFFGCVGNPTAVFFVGGSIQIWMKYEMD